MAGRGAWQRSTQELFSDLDAYEAIRQPIQAIAFLGIPARKDLLRISRAQRSLSANTTLQSQSTCSFASYTSPQDPLLLDKYGLKTSSILKLLSEACHKDIAFSAIVNNLSRSAPFLNNSTTELMENRIASWEKEISATQGTDAPPLLDYTLWFSDSPDFSKALSPYLRPAPHHNHRIWETMKTWRNSVRGRLLYPQIQANKSVSRETARLYHVATTGVEDGYFPSAVASVDLEKEYSLSGREIGGPNEARQTWGYNDITPRTYFAPGGKAFHASKYIRDIINSLTNSFPEVNFHTRFSIHDLPLDKETTAFIYDYSSFTSKLAELKYFMQALADYMDGVEVFIVDSFEGILRTTAGQLIRDYTTTCNELGEFTVQRYDPEDVSIWHQKVAGFLGVYGNIAASTTLHGLHACQLTGDSGGCRCVGDDVFAIGKFDTDTTRELGLEAIQSIGSVNPLKVRWWEYLEVEDEDQDDRSWPYLKRPLDRFHNRMLQEANLYLPIFGLINPIKDEVRDEPEDLYTRVTLLARQTFALIRQAQALFPPLEYDQRALIGNYIRCLYKATGVKGFEGWLPFETHWIHGVKFSGLLLPNVVDDFLLRNPWDLLKSKFDNRPSVLVDVPVLANDDEEEPVLKAIVNRGIGYVGPQGRTSRYLVNLGWASSEMVRELRYLDFEEYSSLYESLYRGFGRRSYELTVSQYAPSWITDFVDYHSGWC